MIKIAILGTRGIPNHHGGFEQFAEYLAHGLDKNKFDITVYNSHNHPFNGSVWNEVKIIHRYDPEDRIGSFGQFFYDLNCILDARRRNFDIILQLGYGTCSIWGWLLPRNAVVTTNMDGMEWKRAKYSGIVRKFLLYAEKLGIKYSDYHIADSIAIQQYISDKYRKDSVFIPYGAHWFFENDPAILSEFDLQPFQYDMLIARLEPENNIETILDGVTKSGFKRPFLVVGKHQTKYGKYLKKRYADFQFINFTGAIYHINTLNNLRYYSNIYFHGHSVGGTNPSLLEAMASSSLVCAHDNEFNRYVLGEDALYFKSVSDIRQIMEHFDRQSPSNQRFIDNNKRKINTIYAWENIIEQYSTHFQEIYQKIWLEKMDTDSVGDKLKPDHQ